MSLRRFALLMAFGTLLAWTAWVIVLFNVNPAEAGLTGLLLFFITLGAALVGTLTLLFSFVRISLLHRNSVPSREIRTSFRHALSFSFVAVISLALSAQGWLQTWHLVALIAAMSLAEALFVQMRRR